MKSKPLIVLSVIIFLALSKTGFSQFPIVKKQLPFEEKQMSTNVKKIQDPNHRDLNWKAPQSIKGNSDDTRKFLYFEGAGYPTQLKGLPSFSESVKFNNNNDDPIVELINQKFETFSETNLISDKDILGSVIKVNPRIVWFKKQPYINITFMPIRKNPTNGTIERLVSFDYKISSKPSTKNLKSLKSGQNYAGSSVLATGNWYKIGVTSDGIFKLSYSYLKSLGLDVDHIAPANLRIYGNGGAMLPMGNWMPRADDLVENPIAVVGEGDSV